MDCGFKSCSYPIFISFLIIIFLFLGMYIIVYIYIAYLTVNYYSNDLVLWRERQLEAIDQKYQSLPIPPPPPITSGPPPLLTLP
jgi:hypothetical protein